MGKCVGAIVGESDELELDATVGNIVGTIVGVIVGKTVGSRLADECRPKHCCPISTHRQQIKPSFKVRQFNAFFSAGSVGAEFQHTSKCYVPNILVSKRLRAQHISFQCRPRLQLGRSGHSGWPKTWPIRRRRSRHVRRHKCWRLGGTVCGAR